MKKILYKLLFQDNNWFTQNVFFISWGKHWKGVYIHFIPYYKIRVFLWGIDIDKRYIWPKPQASRDLEEEPF